MAGRTAMSGAPEVASEGPLSGLAYNHQTSTKIEDLERCPNRLGMALLNYESGVWRPARCGRLGCPYCVRVEALIRAAAIWYSRPRRAIRVSLVADPGDPDPWPTIRRRMNRTREWYKRLTGDDLGEWVYHAEMNPRETGFHAHAWEHGARKVDAPALDLAAHRAGAGWCKVETIRNPGGVGAYGLKGIGGLGYGLKGADSDPLEYLRLNGGRLTHQSRGFFRRQDGRAVGVRQAEQGALRVLLSEGGGGRWGLVTESAARWWASLPRSPGRALATQKPGDETAIAAAG